ncbi:MAG: xanthine dehydrogenase family protein molybdopterin-binding subunit [Pyrinomonadaceae bacterium]
MGKYIGKETSRVEGAAKVTGKAKYAAEFPVSNVAHGFLVMSEIAKGAITKMDASEAEKQSGVIKIISHENAPKLAFTDKSDKDEMAPEGKPFRPFYTDKILFSNQPIALVVAETFEQARFAANLVKVEYKEEKHSTDLLENLDRKKPVPPTDDKQKQQEKPRGNPEKAFEDAKVKLEAEYTIPFEHHNPIEPHAAIALWNKDKLTIFDKSQYVYNVRNHLASIFGIDEENVNVISLFVGGAFGSSLRPNYYPMVAALAAKEVNRPVKLVYTRRQMFTGHGYRPFTWQKVKLGADKKGKLDSIIHITVNNTSSFEEYNDSANHFTRLLYACENVATPKRIVKTDLATPFAMRAPGAVSGMFALECALDELAYKLEIDPLELRLINYAEKDPESGKPFSSKELKKCYSKAAEKFGWKKRSPKPRSMRDGKYLIGMGMASGIWGGFQSAATVRIVLKSNGTAIVQSASSDMGPGTYTVISMITAEFLGLPIEKVKFELGDTNLPKAPVHGGSMTTASVGSAAKTACAKIKEKLFDLLMENKSEELSGVKIEDVSMEDGKLNISGKKSSYSISGILKRNDLTEIEVTHEEKPSTERKKYAIAAHGAQFVEVKIDEDLGIVNVTRVVEATASGKIINPKAAHSQEIGGVVWGIGMALLEETHIDHRYGRITNPQLADYHVPSNADIHAIDTMFIDEEDKIVNELGIKGMGELGMVGIPAAIANAVFHATGKRIRDLPITLDKLL